MATKRQERVSVYEPVHSLRFIPNLCPTCPNFKGERTCTMHISTVQKDDEILHMHRITILDLDNPYSRMNECKTRKDYNHIKQFDKRSIDSQSLIEIELPFKESVLQWMKENVLRYRKEIKTLTLDTPIFKKVIRAIELFYQGKIEELYLEYGAMLTDGRANLFYSLTFERFTGIPHTSYIGTEEELKEELKQLSPFASLLKRAQDTAYVFAEMEEQRDDKIAQWVRNFMSAAKFLLNPNLKVLNYSLSTQMWPYIGTMRDALMFWGNFTEEEFPPYPRMENGWDEKTSSKIYDEHKLVIQNFRKLAFTKLTKK